MPSPMAAEAPELAADVSAASEEAAASAGVVEQLVEEVVEEVVKEVNGESGSGGAGEVPVAAKENGASTSPSEVAAPMTPGLAADADKSTDLEEMIFQVAKAINIDLGAPNPRSQFRKKLASKSFTKKSPEGLVLHSKQMVDASNSLAPSAAKRAVERAIKAAPITGTGTGTVTTREPRTPKPSQAAPTKAAPTKAAASKAKFDRPVKDVPSVPKKTPDPILWEGPPDEPFPAGGNWPDGWVKRVCERTSGATAGQTDKYWITPGVKQRLRSTMEVRRWIKAMQITNGDETEARKLYKKIVV